MRVVRERVRPEFFDDLYASNPDPWDFQTSPYETAKYAATIAALEGRRFKNTLEIGCSIGVLTQQLKHWTDELLAIDVSAAALDGARARNPGVDFQRREIPEDYPDGDFDLVVASEVLYYLDRPALRDTIERFAGTLLAVHWRGPTERYPFTGDEVHAQLSERFGAPAYSAWTDKYALDRWDACGS
ncbi:nodulation protein S (NodS) [Solirubrobacter pauli]|uniref:Nodulation protein S (NodS) n=1 Tax=Solirubrobacter pauli TaxID=166793 RepID=A0A660KV74_9ACTN|nr:nodulation protein S (NodS) [Solirubrobacter pauli]